METDEIEEGLENLAQKRSYIYDSKKESLRREIGQLRDFFSSMEKEREILECQVKATQALCRRKLVKAEKELQQAQARLRETQNEAAVLLEGKHQEMERLQKERDDCKAQADHLAGECDFVKGYTHYLEEKICLLIAKLHEYHEDLQKKTEEIVETRSRAVSELEWVKQSMLNFEKNLLEFHNTNSQFSSDKENLIQKLQGLKQLEAPTSVEKLADGGESCSVESQIDPGLHERVQKLENDLDLALKRADSADSRLNEADAIISNLRRDVSQLEHEVQQLKEKNLEYVTEKIEAEAGTQLREAAISVLKLRIYALEGDLQKERDFKNCNSLPNKNTKTLTQLSPDIDVEIRARPGLIVKKEGNSSSDYALAKLEAAKYQLQEDAETIKKLKQRNSALETDLKKERNQNTCSLRFSSDSWSTKKMKKLEQALADAHERYALLQREMNDLRVKKASAYTLERDRLERECFSRNFTQPSQETLESNSEPAHVEEGPLDEDSKHSSWSRSACSCNWISDEDRPAQQQRDHRIVVPRLF
ncbi:hypothetical protein KP509_17G005900 [Ceratopteris richardii]|uniref:Uncharacterized protein n=1 Tax=Ceratopteris richardii TaxID=49495 RepID=A0A8T2SVL2_CERRI|nr:hypothetical protein KP509_17G005900 [Ceratopteris richardii]